MNGRLHHCLLDSGADASLIPAQLVDSRNVVSCEQHLTAANNTEIRIEGQVQVKIKIEGQTLSSTFLVSPNIDEIILGRNWLAQNSVIWNFGANRVAINGKRCKLYDQPKGVLRCKRCRISTDVDLPANSEAVVPADLVYGHFQHKTADEQWATIPAEPIPGLRIARTLVPSDRATVAVRVCNITRRPLKISKGLQIGSLQQVNVADTPAKPPDRPPTDIEQRQSIVNGADQSLSPPDRLQLGRLLEEYRDIFSYSEYDLGHTGLVQHEIDTGENRPFRQPLCPQPRAMLPVIDQLVDDMQDQGIIEPCQSDWCSNLILVKKKDGSNRFCVDYRKLNSISRKDAYPLPRIDTCLDTLSGALWYSTFDLRSGFHQVQVSPTDANKTTFVCHRGTYRFSRLPFGLCNAPATFQRLMDTVLMGLNFEICLVYLDDIIVFSHSLKSHLDRLRKLCDRLRDACLKLKPSKCCLMQKQVSFLGYQVSQSGVATDPQKIAAIRDWPVPSNLRQCRAFVGICQYYRKFVPNFSEIAAPLHALTKKGARFIWDDSCQAAYEHLKNALTTAPTLALPNDEGEFLLDCDASDHAIGAVLSQVQDGVEKPICYASQLYNRHEKNYNVTRKELLAVVTFVRKFRQYLLGRRFRIRTDHAALQWLKRTPEPIGQQARWLEILEEYDYEIIHRAGTQHGNADALSRRDINQISAAPADAPPSPPAGEPPIDWPTVQSQDPDLRDVYDIVKTGSTPPPPEDITHWSRDAKVLHAQIPCLTLSRTGILRRQWSRAGQNFDQIVVPRPLRAQIADQLHRGLNRGQLGQRRARLVLQRRYYWPGWSHEVSNAQCRCDRCARYKRPQNPRSGQLQPMVVGEPWERIGVDITGPHPQSARGNIYVLTVIDHFTKWVEMFPMRNQEAATVAKLLVDRVFCTHGCPIQILTDQGRNFESDLFREVCKRLSIDKVRTSAYKPSTNGNIERFHTTMHSMLAKLVSDNQKDWDSHLPAVAFAYRTTVNEATGYTPFFLTYGREARIPADLCYGPPPNDHNRYSSHAEYAEQAQDRLRQAYELVEASVATPSAAKPATT